MNRTRQLRNIFDRLLRAFGPQHWWPAETPLEVIVGAILTQNTAWGNVERAIQRLRGAEMLSWKKLRDVPEQKLAELIQPSGTYRVKAKRLKAFVERLWSSHGGSLEAMLGGSLEEARTRLLDIHGIGPETADAILLYAAGRPTFVVDAYTMRILSRHYFISPHATYERVHEVIESELPREADLFNEFHALLVEVGKRFCGPKARCENCPLASLPHDKNL